MPILSLILILCLVFSPGGVAGDLSSPNGRDCRPLLVDPELAEKLAVQEESRDFSYYAFQMDASMQEKMAVIFPWVPTKPGARIVDVGTGTGALAAQMAEIWPNSEFIGVDLSSEMLDIARSKFGEVNNLELVKASAQNLNLPPVDAFIYSSIVHEINSYDPRGKQAVKEAFQRAYDLLVPGGRLIVRDFARPTQADQVVRFSHKKKDMTEGQTFMDFVSQFGRGVTGTVIENKQEHILYETTLGWYYEYIFRKDYHNNWKAELEELYGFWTLEEAVELLEGLGFQIIYKHKIRNQWIIENRLEGLVEAYDSDHQKLDFPDYQLVIVVEKPKLLDQK